MGDVAVPESGQVSHRQLGAEALVGVDGVDATRSQRPTDRHDGGLGAEAVDAPGGEAATGEDHAVDPVGEERLDGAVLGRRRAPAVGDDDLVSGVVGGVVDPVGDLGEPRVVEIVEQHAERRRAPAGEVAGGQVGPVAESIGGLADGRPRTITDPR